MHVTAMTLVDFNRLCTLQGKPPVSEHERYNNQFVTRQGIGDYFPDTGILRHKAPLPAGFVLEGKC